MSIGDDVRMVPRPVERFVDTALRIAWLRVHAEDLRPFDPTGQLSAALADFAELLTVAEERGWFG